MREEREGRERERRERVLGREMRQIGASNGALAMIGKATGLLTDKVDVNVMHSIKPGLTLEELEDRLARGELLRSKIIDGEASVLADDDIRA